MRRQVAARSILTRTGGFLEGFTHTLNPYRGCSFGKALCGTFCYAAEMGYGRRGVWGEEVEAKTNAAELYRRDLARERRRGPVRIFFSSVTDPYVPQERGLGLTRALLAAMVEAPPDRLVLQTHTAGPLRDLDLLGRIGCDLAVNITVETDRATLPGFPPPAASPGERIAALAAIRQAGLAAVGVVAPLLPLQDPEAFARALDAACTRVILDHWLIGDGSPGGARTRRRGFPERLERAGFGDWNRLDVLEETAGLFRSVLGPDRVSLSRAGFNATPPAPPPTSPSRRGVS